MNRREFFITAGIAPMVGGRLATAQETAVLRASTWLPPQHVLNKNVLAFWAKELETATQGKVRVNTLPKPVAAPPGTFDAIADGVADIAANVHGYSPGRYALTSIAEFPGAGDSAEAASVAYQRVHDKHLAKFGEHKKLKVLAVFANGPGHIFSTKRPVKKLADLAGMRIRVGGGMVNDLANALGVSAVLKPASESYELLSAGIVDGVFFPVEPIVTFKLDKTVRYGTLIPGGLYNTSWAMVMNQATFDRLPPEHQRVIDRLSGERLARLTGRVQDTNDKHALEVSKASGVEYVVADDNLLAEISAKTKPLEEAWFRQAAKIGADGAALLAAYRQELKSVAVN